MKIGSYGYTAENPNKSKPGWTVYYNPKCSKCRETLDLLRLNRIDPKIIEYMETPLSKGELKGLLESLNIPLEELVRSNEKVLETLSLDFTNQDQVLETIVEHPELLQRPIVLHAGKAVIARPPEKVLEWIS